MFKNNFFSRILKKDSENKKNYNGCLLTNEVMNGIESKEELKKSEKNVVIQVDK